MPSPFLVPCLVVLRSEFDAIAPGRDKASDGWIGDAAHQAEKSDHNPDALGRVHAIDVDNTGPWPDGWSMERAVQLQLNRHRAGADDRLQNVIYNRRIWSRSWGWGQRAYTGPSPHTEHAHFSARHDSTRDHTQPWGILAAYEEENVDWKDKPWGSDYTVAQAIQGTYGAAAATAAQLTALQTTVAGILANVQADDSEKAQILADAKAKHDELLAAVGQVDDQVIARLAGQSNDQLVAALKAALGDRAVAVGRLLAGS